MYLFTHIPKTGGMSVYETFKNNVDPGGMIGDGIERDFFYAVHKIANNEIHCIFGHFRYGFHNLVPITTTPIYLTFLRDPVQREASYYFYRRNRAESLRNEIEDVDRVDNVEAWFLSPLRRKNFQTQYLCGYPIGQEPDLDLALENMTKNYAFVGLTERMGESLDMLCRQLGFSAASPVHVNATPGRPPMEVELYEKLRTILSEEDELDIRLYEEAKVLFKERENEMRGLGGVGLS
jgi:hypothetical protein